MSVKNMYSGPVEKWIGLFILHEIGLTLPVDEDFSFYSLCDDFGILIGLKEKAVFELERVKISNYFGYSIRVRPDGPRRRIYTLSSFTSEGEESFTVNEFLKSTTGISRKWYEDYEGLKAWPRQ